MQSNYILVQSWMPLAAAQMKKLQDLDLVLQEYVSKNTYLYHRHGADLDLLRRLSFVVFVGIYRQEYKISTGLGNATRRARGRLSPVPREVDIVFHKSAIAEKVRESIATVLGQEPDTLRVSRHKLWHTVHERQLDELASIDEVRAIVETDRVEARCHIAREIMRVREWVDISTRM